MYLCYFFQKYRKLTIHDHWKVINLTKAISELSQRLGASYAFVETTYTFDLIVKPYFNNKNILSYMQ